MVISKKKTWPFLFSLALLFLSPPSAMAGDIVIIVNGGSQMTAMSTDEIASYFTKRKKDWLGGVKVTPIERNEGSPERALFLAKVLKKSAAEMASYWLEKKQTSGDSSPQQVSSDAMVIQFVGLLPGAIGYISPASITGDALKKVKILATVSD